MTLPSWWAAGSRIPVQTQVGEAQLFVWEAGRGPTVTLLHGYPGSSYDWSQAAPDLITRYRVIAPDFLGFGTSDKPYPHPYSLREQADLLEQVWSALNVSQSAVVAHDYSTSIAQELLRRDSPRLTSLVFLNGAVYPTLHRPTEGQLGSWDPTATSSQPSSTKTSGPKPWPRPSDRSTRSPPARRVTCGTLSPATTDGAWQPRSCIT